MWENAHNYSLNVTSKYIALHVFREKWHIFHAKRNSKYIQLICNVPVWGDETIFYFIYTFIYSVIILQLFIVCIYVDVNMVIINNSLKSFFVSYFKIEAKRFKIFTKILCVYICANLGVNCLYLGPDLWFINKVS